MDPYRNAVGRLYRGEAEVGLVLVEVEPHATQVAGHLWWRRWSESTDMFFLSTIVDGKFDDSVVQDGIDDELIAFEQHRFGYYGEVLRVRWLDHKLVVLRAHLGQRVVVVTAWDGSISSPRRVPGVLRHVDRRGVGVKTERGSERFIPLSGVRSLDGEDGENIAAWD